MSRLERLNELNSEISELESSLNILQSRLKLLKNEKSSIEYDNRKQTEIDIVASFHRDLVNNHGIKIGRPPSGFNALYGSGYDINSYHYPLIPNTPLTNYQSSHTSGLDIPNNSDLQIINLKQPSNVIEEFLYQTVLDYITHKLPIAVNIQPEIWGYEDEHLVSSDYNIIFDRHNNPYLIVYYLQGRNLSFFN